MNQIVKQNIEKILSNEPGGREFALREDPESIAGNALTWKGFMCRVSQFSYDPQSGKIIYFGNMIPESIENDPKLKTAAFRFATNVTNLNPITYIPGRDRIVNFFANDSNYNPSDLVISETIKTYNQKHAFKPEGESIKLK